MAATRKIAELAEAVSEALEGELVHPVTNVSGTEAVTTSGHYYSVKWAGQCEGVTELRDGMMVNIKIPVQGNATYHTVLDINGLGEHPVCRNVTTDADAYVADSIITLIYDANAQALAFFDSSTATTVTGVWKIGDYDSQNTFQLRHAANAGTFIAATNLPEGVICLQQNETTLIPVNATGGTGTSKVLTTESFNPFGAIVYVKGNYSANDNISSNVIFEQSLFDLRISFNTGSTLTNNKDVYICAVPQTDGMAKLDISTPIVQELPSTDDGKIYIYIGHIGSSSKFELHPVHPVYWFKGGKVVPYTVLDITGKADKVSGATNGNLAGLDGNGNLKDSGKKASDFQLVITDGAQVGMGYGICSTAAATAAKTASISNFILLTNGIVAIRFTNAISVPDATLNISSTGAKAIKIDGGNIQPGVIKAGMTAVMQYDGTNFNIIALSGLEQSASPSDLYVDMGLPSGVLWATRNIDVTQPNGFAASPYQYECSFFSWGDVDGHNPISDSAFDYDFINKYASTPGAALTGNISPSFDAARVNCGTPWRLPTKEEFAELFNYITYIDANGDDIPTAQANKLTTVNGVTGLLLKSTVNGKTLFFPCSGAGIYSPWLYRGGYGHYWTSSLVTVENGRILYFYSGEVDPQNNAGRYSGFTIRPVQ